MSCQLYWRPLGDGEPVGGSQLRDAITNEFGDDAHLDRAALPFLRGLRAAKVDGAADLIEAIEQHGEVALFLKC